MAQNNQAVSVKKQPAEKMALWKIIVLAVSLTIIAALIITIIVFACVKINLLPKINFNAEQGITVTYNSDDYKGSNNYAKDNEKALNIINKLNDGFSTSMLNSFTEGLNSKNAYDIKYQATGSKSYSTMKNESKYTLCFMFEADHTLETADGKTFTYGSQETVYRYRQMVVLLSDANDNFGEVEIWFFTDTNDYTSSNVKLTAYGDFSSVLDYLDKLAKEA